MASNIIYIHSGNTSEFVEYQKQNPQYDCVLILDGITLRGRTPSNIIRIGTHAEKWNAQEIEESIYIHENLWQKEMRIRQVSNDDDSSDDQNILDYGIE